MGKAPDRRFGKRIRPYPRELPERACSSAG